MLFNQYNTSEGSNMRTTRYRDYCSGSRLYRLPRIILSIIMTLVIMTALASCKATGKDGFGRIYVTEDNEYGGNSYEGSYGYFAQKDPDRMGEFPEGALDSLKEKAPLLCETQYDSVDLVYHRNEQLMEALVRLETQEDIEKVTKAYRDFYQHYDYFEERISETDTKHPDGPFLSYSYTCLKESYAYEIGVRHNRDEKRVEVQIHTKFLEDEEIEQYEQYRDYFTIDYFFDLYL